MTDIQATRARLVEEMRAHQAADRLAQGAYWDNGKGCAVGCAMQSLDPDAKPDDHARYAEMIGAPEMLVRLEDCIFEGLPKALAMEWPVRFTIALRDSGADEEALRRACMRLLHTTVSRSLEKGQPISAEKVVARAVERAVRLGPAPAAEARAARAARPEPAPAAVARAVARVMERVMERAVQALAVAYAELADTLIEEIEAASKTPQP